jgi:hypothetical protein
VPVNQGNQSAVDPRRSQSAVNKTSRSASAVDAASKLSARRPRTSRFAPLTRQDTDPFQGLKNDFGSVLLRILSNIASTPDLDDEFTIRKRALEARDRRLILTKDDRYFNLLKQLEPQKVSGEKRIED